MNNVGFCNNCFEKVSYTTKTEQSLLKIKNKKVAYDEEVAICENCGNELQVPKVDDKNAKTREKTFDETVNSLDIKI